ncbi:MAG: hypothetical protein IIC18_04300 [Bacteroidetes bacterium]|nr:hypothetical protein [Bacteroidota bacterium]
MFRRDGRDGWMSFSGLSSSFFGEQRSASVFWRGALGEHALPPFSIF